MRVGIGESGQADLLQVMQGALFGIAAPQSARGQQREHDVLLDRLPRRQLVELLKHHDAIRAGLAHLGAIQADAAADRLDKAGHGLEQGGLSAPRRAKQHETIGTVHLEADFMGGAHYALWGAVFEADLLHL
ncbi:hypothetical protein D9M68_809880 [compost metagenome]